MAEESKTQDLTSPTGLVQRWEINNMINTAILAYDTTVAQPRHNGLQNCMTKVETLLAEIRGGMTVVKYAAAALGMVGTTCGILYSIGKITGHL